MRLPVFLSAALMVLTAGVNASASVSFTLASYTVNAYSGSNGLLIETANLLGPTTFELTNEGDMYMADLFRIWTPESNVGLGEDTIAQNISVDFEFTAPAPAFGGSVEGVTVGVLFFNREKLIGTAQRLSPLAQPVTASCKLNCLMQRSTKVSSG